jgi:nitronate monooxygenase
MRAIIPLSIPGLDLPIIQAPMAGVQDSALALAVCEGGGLGSLPAAMLAPDDLARQLALLATGTARPWNVNFFAHTPPPPDPAREAAWRARLAPYYREFGIGLFGFESGAALATVVGVLIEVPVMLLVVKVVNASKGWRETA